MAFPFGGHPTLADYIGQARHDHNATAKSGTASSEDGKAECITRIEMPNGNVLVVVGILQSERLTPTDIGMFDRRLGIISPYFSVTPDE